MTRKRRPHHRQLAAGRPVQSGRSPGLGGTLNIGNNALVILSADTAILGSQTNLGVGGSLTALNGLQLGNPSSVDATKVLTATGNAQINANFVNNGVVNGPTSIGQELTFTKPSPGPAAPRATSSTPPAIESETVQTLCRFKMCC